MTPPPLERTLRELFWRLLFRGRAAHEVASHRRRRRLGLGVTIGMYAALGVFPAMGAFFFEPLSFACSLHGMTLMFASLTLASSAGTMLFVREEADILLHRPVPPAALLRAKCTVLLWFASLLALALNAGGLVTSFWNRGNAWWFAAAHLVTTALLMLFSAAVIVLVYNVCLRWFGRERLDNLLTLVQVAASIAMVVGAQLVPRLLDHAALRRIDTDSALALALPPVWFGALDMVLCAARPFAEVWLPAAIGVAATALLTWLAFVRLGAAYGIGLLALGENASPRSAHGREPRRLLGAVVARAPLRWWLRDPVERHAFLLVSAYLRRDRETKLKLYPTLAPLVVMPLVVGLRPGRRDDAGPAPFLAVFALSYAAIVPIQALLLLRRSEHWRAADTFRTAPLPHWAPLFHGARKAVVCWLAVPALLLVAAVLAALHGTWTPFAVVMPASLTVLVASYAPALGGAWLPLAEPSSDQHGSAAGCLVFGVVMVASAAVGGLAAWLHTLGWFWPFVAAAGVAAVALQVVLARSLRARPWRPAVR
jgi:ABC-2 type transport system permease protein